MVRDAAVSHHLSDVKPADWGSTTQDEALANAGSDPPKCYSSWIPWSELVRGPTGSMAAPAGESHHHMLFPTEQHLIPLSVHLCCSGTGVSQVPENTHTWATSTRWCDQPWPDMHTNMTGRLTSVLWCVLLLLSFLCLLGSTCLLCPFLPCHVCFSLKQSVWLCTRVCVCDLFLQEGIQTLKR